MGKDKNEIKFNIKKLVNYGNNLLGHEHIYVVSEEDYSILGILVSYCGRETSLLEDLKVFLKLLNFKDFLKLMFKGSVINGLLVTSAGRNDYYLSNIAVNPVFRVRE